MCDNTKEVQSWHEVKYSKDYKVGHECPPNTKVINRGQIAVWNMRTDLNREYLDSVTMVNVFTKMIEV